MMRIEARARTFIIALLDPCPAATAGATLREAELGDGLARLALASLVWHEMAHAKVARAR
jgi:hypothetical protein